MDISMNIAAASYCNFLITNGAVLSQKFWKPGLPLSWRKKDQEAKKILQTLFPDRKIYQFDAMAINIGGGGIHCITQQEPFVQG
jgi:agmatine deiminase